MALPRWSDKWRHLLRNIAEEGLGWTATPRVSTCRGFILHSGGQTFDLWGTGVVSRGAGVWAMYAQAPIAGDLFIRVKVCAFVETTVQTCRKLWPARRNSSD